VVGFLLVGGICIGLRYRAIQRAEVARQDSLWELIYDVQFEPVVGQAGQEEAAVRLWMPFDTRHCRVISGRESNDSFTVPDPNLEIRVFGPAAFNGNYYLRLSTRQEGTTLYKASAKFSLHVSPRPDFGPAPPLENLSLDASQRYTGSQTGSQREVIIPIADPEVREIAGLIPDEGETDLERVQWIFDYCSGIDSTAEAATDDAKVALTTLRGTPKARARAMVTLCRIIGQPARLVAGFRIRQGANIEPHVWVEVFHNQSWIPFDPTDGWAMSLPMDYLPVRRDADEVFEINENVNAASDKHVYSIKKLGMDRRILRGDVRHPVQILNLKRLPVAMHTVLTILLLLPFAALITAFMRNVVGLQTFGTFSPALLAMSFIYADWRTGVLILLIVVIVGLFGREFLERLRLLMVPRLSIVLTMVILVVVFTVSALYHVLPAIRGDAVLLPMVILTMLIERFHVTMEEDGFMFTLQLAIGTVIVAALCFAVLGWEEVGEFVLTYPESHFFTIAAFIVLGRYAGYRMTELWRFRDLVDSTEAGR
jgi:transglutaminase-like putative cysteine protease